MSMNRGTDDLVAKLFLLGICIVLLIIFCYYRESKWNNGYCECGGKWEYQQAIGHQYTTNYQYKCDKCGKIEEFGKLR
jgi:hypothetical protein